MSRRHPKHFIPGKHFAAIPTEVLTSDAFKTLSDHAARVLLAIAAQFHGYNNGDLSMTWKTCVLYGINSKGHLVESLKELQARGLVEKTKQGGKKPLGPTLYAITWQPINDLKDKIRSGATTTAANTWTSWKDTSGKKSPSGINRLSKEERQKKRQDRIRTTTGPDPDHKITVTGPDPDQRTPFNGTGSGPPSRSWGEGHTVSAPASAQFNPVFTCESVAEGATPKAGVDKADHQPGIRMNRPASGARAAHVTLNGSPKRTRTSEPDSEAEQLRKAQRYLQSQPDASNADVARILSIPLSIAEKATQLRDAPLEVDHNITAPSSVQTFAKSVCATGTATPGELNGS